jgi:hypothetical protein
MESSYAAKNTGMETGFDHSFEAVETKNNLVHDIEVSVNDIVPITQLDIRRDPQGIIDYDYYHRRADRLRSDMFFSVTQAMVRFFMKVIH